MTYSILAFAVFAMAIDPTTVALPAGDIRISDALIVLVVIVLGVFGTLALLVPNIVKRQVAIMQTAQENRITANQEAITEAQEAAKQERAAADEQRKQFSRMIDASIKRDEAAVEVQRATVKAFSRQLEMTAHQTELQETSNKELRANTKVSTEGVEAISDLSTNIDEMQTASKKATDSIQEAIEQLHKEIAEGLIITTDTSEKVTFITTKITEVDTMKNTLQQMLKVSQAQLVMAWRNSGSPPELKPEGANGAVVGIVAAPADGSAQPIMPGDNVTLARAGSEEA